MKLCWFLFTLGTTVFLPRNTFSQDIIYADSIFGIFDSQVQIGIIGHEYPCSDTILVNNNAINRAFDIMALPNEEVYGYGISSGFFDTSLMRINFTGSVNPNSLYVFDSYVQGLTCDENEYAYAAGIGITKLFYFPEEETYLGDLPPTMRCQGDITYRRGKFYLSSINNQLVEVNMKAPSLSKVVMDFPPGTLPIDGLATVQVSCDSVVTYAIGRAPDHSIVYEINFDNWTLTELCDMDGLSITGAGSQTECMLPPCDLFLDLDSDNSSFAFRGDFCADTFCIPPVAVADTDVVIISASGNVESIVLELTGILDPGSEYLSVAVPPNISVSGNNTALLTLQDNGSATIADFENAVKAVQYFNDALPFSQGLRKVMATAFAAGESSLVSVAELPLSNESLQLQVETNWPSCNGFPDGSISVMATGGTAPYDYQWQSGQTGSTLNGLAAGSYPLTFSDAAGCTKRDTLTLDEPDLLTASINYTGPPETCSPSGLLEGLATGGTGTLEYSWDNGVNGNQNPNVGAGSYLLTVTDSNACTATASFEIPAGDTSLTLQAEAVCTGGGFDWNGNVYFTDTLVCQVFTPPSGCDSTVCLSLSLNPVPVVAITIGGNFCDSDEVLLSASPNDFYLWSNGATTSETSIAQAGNYAVTVTNNFGCTASASANVPPAIAFDLLETSPSCFGENDGSIAVENAIGGTPPLMYSIDGSAFFPVGIFENLPPGSYTLTVEDADGCREELPIELDAPQEIFLDAGADLEIELGESISLTANTNLSDPVVSWRPPDYLDCADCLNTGALPLASISYEVEVADSNGCTATDTVNIVVFENSSVYVPNAFSPNGDGINDYFTVYSDLSVLEIRSLRVFGRWGEMVFEKKGLPPNVPEQGWDGTFKKKPVPAGTYVYMAEVLKVDGGRELLSGGVQLLR